MKIILNGETFYIRPDDKGHLMLWTPNSGTRRGGRNPPRPAELRDLPITIVGEVSQAQAITQ